MINLSILNIKDKIEINEEYNYSDWDYGSSGISKLENVFANGYILITDTESYAANLKVSGTMYISDSITLNLVPYHFSFEIDDDIPENCINSQNSLDILELLWQNIVLEIPISYTKEKDDANFANRDSINSNADDSIDPRMQKLYDYFNEGGE